jgi:PAS domain S-box-containing protein
VNGRATGSALNASLLLDGEDRILEGNRDAEVFLEKPLEEARKIPLSVVNPSFYTALKDLIAKSKRGRGVENYSLAYKVGKNLMGLSISVTPYPLEALGTTGTLITIYSMAGRPAAERREKEREKEGEKPAPTLKPEDLETFSGFLRALIEPAFILDLQANFIYANPRMCELIGQAEEELVGRPLSFFLAREEAKKTLGSLVEAVRSNPWRGELEFRRGNGTTSTIAVTISPLKAGKAKTDRLLGIGRDYSDEARVWREREEELKRIWGLMERVGLALATITPDLRVTLLSQSAEEILGTTSDRAIGTPLPELLPADAAESMAALLKAAVEGEEIREAELIVEGAKGAKRTLFIDIRPAVMTEGKPREYMVVLKETTREISQAEKAQALLVDTRLQVRFLELAVSNNRPETFLASCLALMEKDFGCRVGAAYLREGEEVVLKAQRGLDGQAEGEVGAFKLRPGYRRVCSLLHKLEIEIHGGAPSMGWEELRSLIEDAEALLPLFREKRWKSIVILPLREKDIRGALVLVDCKPKKLGMVDDELFSATGEKIASVLSGLEVIEGGRAGGEEGAGGAALTGDSSEAPTAVIEKKDTKESVRTMVEEEEEKEEDWNENIRTIIKKQEEEEIEEKEKEHHLMDIAREAKKMEASEENLTMWWEQDLEKPSISPEGVDLSSFLIELKELVVEEVNMGEIFLELEEDLPKIHTDPRILREALYQLLDNALKFSPLSSPVILGAERWGDEVLLRVEDQGPGIAPEVVEEVMRSSTAEEGHERTVYHGHISGLFRCQRYVVALGGDLSMKGRTNEGTTAFVRLRVLPFVGEGL